MPDDSPSPENGSIRPALAAASVVLAAIVYTVLVLAGLLDESRRIDAVHFGLLIIAAAIAALAVRPDAFPFKRVEASGVRLEMLERVRVRQDAQEHVLDMIRMTLPFLLPPTERKRLRNLSRRRTAGDRGGGALRAELRRLRSIGPIEMTSPDRHVGHLRGGAELDLIDHVRLTPLGARWVEQIDRIEEADAADDPAEEGTGDAV